MKTKTLNVHDLAKEWKEKHITSADELVCAADGTPIEARYHSPYKAWAGRYGDSGNIEVPDMDYYNTLKDPEEIRIAIEGITHWIEE